MQHTKQISRRIALRSATSMIGLPLLESYFPHRTFALANNTVQPKRMMFIGFGWGVTSETWFPNVKSVGESYELSEGLVPLAKHQKDMTVIQGCVNRFSNEAHWGSTFWLTGANRYSEPGQSFYNSISADQVAAEVLGRDTRFTSIQMSCENGEESGHGPGLSLAWNRQGKPLAGLNHPLTAFHRLFSNESTPLAVRQAMIKQQRSVLDTVLDDAKRVSSKLNKEDQEKLGEYFQSVRDIETRIAKEEQWLDVPKAMPSTPIEKPDQEIKGYDEIKLMYDIAVAALESDATRVLTYRQPVDRLLQSLDIPFTGHNMSHYSPGPRMEASQLRDEKQSELLAYLIDRLKSTKVADGTSLFDHTCLAYGSNIQSIHYLDNCPTIVAGGAAKIKLGRHLVLPKNTPLCNVWLTLLQGIGLDVTSHGDSSGIVSELLA